MMISEGTRRIDEQCVMVCLCPFVQVFSTRSADVEDFSIIFLRSWDLGLNSGWWRAFQLVASPMIACSWIFLLSSGIR